MTAKEYQGLAIRSDDIGCSFDVNNFFENQGKADNLGYLLNYVLGMCGEAGELSERLQKYVFHGTQFNREHMIKGLGDVLWYIAMCCNVIDTSLEDVMEANIEKLKERHPRGYTKEYMADDGKVF